jgi:hypothetical protein
MAEMGDKAMAERAKFLEGLGLKRNDVAEMLGTSSASITEQYRQAKRKNGANGRAAKKKGHKAK